MLCFCGKPFFFSVGLPSCRWSHLSDCVDSALHKRCFRERSPHVLTPPESSELQNPCPVRGLAQLPADGRRMRPLGSHLQRPQEQLSLVPTSGEETGSGEGKHLPKVTRLPSAMLRPERKPQINWWQTLRGQCGKVGGKAPGMSY